MALSEEQLKLVRDSWEVLKPDTEAHGLQLFKNIFEVCPQATGLFSFLSAGGGRPEDNTMLQKHARSVFQLVGETMVKLGDKGEIEAVAPALMSLGRRHLKYGVVPEHYDIVGKALLQTLETGLGEKWSHEVKSAWSQAFVEVAKIMQQGLYERTAMGSSQGSSQA